MTTDDEPAVADVFASQFSEAPTVVSSAPGRVNLIGGHVDYNDGVVLPAAIDRRTVVAARLRTDGTVRAYSARLDEHLEATVGSDVDGWGAYVVGVATVLAEAAEKPLGADLVIGGDMILGAGVSSSASLEVAVAGALNDTHDLGLEPERLADACWRAETEEVGMACGIMDQYASALGQAGHALRLDCRSREIDPLPVDADRVRLLVVDITVTHELTDSGFNDRVRECREATERLDAALERPINSLRDVTPEDVEANVDALPSPLAQRARHVTTELRRVDEAVDALADGDLERLGSLVRASHRSLREEYDVSCPELDAVVEALDDCGGVYGARMTGGGWGGSVVALVEPGATSAVTETVRRRYRAATDLSCDVYALDIGDGLRVERCGSTQ